MGDGVGGFVTHHDHCVGGAVAGVGKREGVAVVGDWVVGARVGPGTGVMRAIGVCGADVPGVDGTGGRDAVGENVVPGFVGGKVGVFGQYGSAHT